MSTSNSCENAGSSAVPTWHVLSSGFPSSSCDSWDRDTCRNRHRQWGCAYAYVSAARRSLTDKVCMFATLQ
jgi:hypothetical protein